MNYDGGDCLTDDDNNFDNMRQLEDGNNRKEAEVTIHQWMAHNEYESNNNFDDPNEHWTEQHGTLGSEYVAMNHNPTWMHPAYGQSSNYHPSWMEPPVPGSRALGSVETLTSTPAAGASEPLPRIEIFSPVPKESVLELYPEPFEGYTGWGTISHRAQRAQQHDVKFDPPTVGIKHNHWKHLTKFDCSQCKKSFDKILCVTKGPEFWKCKKCYSRINGQERTARRREAAKSRAAKLKNN